MKVYSFLSSKDKTRIIFTPLEKRYTSSIFVLPLKLPSI